MVCVKCVGLRKAVAALILRCATAVQMGGVSMRGGAFFAKASKAQKEWMPRSLTAAGAGFAAAFGFHDDFAVAVGGGGLAGAEVFFVIEGGGEAEEF